MNPDLNERLETLYEEYGRMTVKELLTSTNNIALPKMVSTKALMVLNNKLDVRPFTFERRLVPEGAGPTVDFQAVTAAKYRDWTEGNALAAADPTLAKVTATVASFGDVTKITDILRRTSAIAFAEKIGLAHGSAVQQGIFDKSIDKLAAATTNLVNIGTKGDSTEADPTFDNVSSAIGKIVDNGFAPDQLWTAPSKLWTMATTDWDKKLFYGALADFIISGKMPVILGLKTLADPYHELAINADSAWNGTNGEKYAVVSTTTHGFAWAELDTDPLSEVYRKGDELSNYIVTHLDGGAAGPGVDKAVSVIRHAA